MRYKGKEFPRLYLYDVMSSDLEGVRNELGQWGYNRDGKKGKKRIVIGLLTDGKGVSVSVETFKGNTNGTKTFLYQVKKLTEMFGIKEVTMVDDRGMIRSAQIEGLKEEYFNYITALTKSQIEKLIKKGVIQLELFITEKVCEIESEGIRYILRRNPARVEDIEKTRVEKLAKIQSAIEKENKYLLEHKRASALDAKKKVSGLLEKLKINGLFNSRR